MVGLHSRYAYIHACIEVHCYICWSKEGLHTVLAIGMALWQKLIVHCLRTTDTNQRPKRSVSILCYGYQDWTGHEGRICVFVLFVVFVFVLFGFGWEFEGLRTRQLKVELRVVRDGIQLESVCLSVQVLSFSKKERVRTEKKDKVSLPWFLS